MNIHFHKYHGAGNDFIIIDNRTLKHRLTTVQIAKLCNRRFGIGADGLMLLELDNNTDFRMKYYNSDGKEGSMCGNGGRCIVAFAKAIGIDKKHYEFNAVDGLHEAFIQNHLVDLKMSEVKIIQKVQQEWFLDTGSPHVVKCVDSIKSVNVTVEGEKLRYDERFGPNGSNVNFIEINEQQIEIRTFERGVEAETYACGTGAVASAIIANQIKPDIFSFKLNALGGQLEVKFEKTENTYHNIWLKGPAEKVFEGQFILE